MELYLHFYIFLSLCFRTETTDIPEVNVDVDARKVFWAFVKPPVLHFSDIVSSYFYESV
jgi:hypothetical protein